MSSACAHSEFSGQSAVSLLDGYRRRKFSPVEVVQDLLGAIEALNASLNAFYLVDDEGALAAARASEARWAAGRPCGPLDGVPTSAKDALATKGWPSYRGSAAHLESNVFAAEDTPAIARMREAGAILLGKTTMPDFGIMASGKSSQHGVARNPWDVSRTPGGSSAGAAASIAAGLNPIAVGTDIVGSIRLPASFSGLFGLKPSQGRVPYYFPNSPSLVAGPMARNVEDAALLMNVISRPDRRDFTALPYDPVDYLASVSEKAGPWRLGYCASLGFGLQPEADVLSLVDRARERIGGSLGRIQEVTAAFTADDLRAAELFYKVRCLSELRRMGPEAEQRAPEIAKWVENVCSISAADFYDVFNTTQAMREKAARLMDEYDFILLPTVHVRPFAAEAYGPSPDSLFEPWANCFLFNLTGQPASSVPCGVTKGGLPIGLQIVGKPYDDVGVLQISRRIEQILATAPKAPDMAAETAISEFAGELK